MNIVVPMVGEGSRFKKYGYDTIKPLIDCNGIPMVQFAINSLNIEGNYVFVVRNSHYEECNLDKVLKDIKSDCKIIRVDEITEGATCSVLLAKEYIDNNQPLIILNSDQAFEYNSNLLIENKDDGCILVFNSDHPKWSYAKLKKDGYVSEVAEKVVISNLATVGGYYWKRGSDFVKYANHMIRKNIRVNGEFYVCPVYNEAIEDNKKISTIKVDKMIPLGTPEDLKCYLKNYL